MAYQLPQVRVSPVSGIQVPIVRDRGRPRIYNGRTLPVSFRVPEPWRVEGSAKAKGSINLTKLFTIYYREFLNRPVEETQAFMDRWEEENGPIVEVYP